MGDARCLARRRLPLLARRADYLCSTLPATGWGSMARMNSYQVSQTRVEFGFAMLAQGDMARAGSLLGQPYSISGHVVARAQ
jgi:hypothetical protein